MPHSRLKTVIHVIGARPNYMKIAPRDGGVASGVGHPAALVSTGQHYDQSMAGSFLNELELPASRSQPRRRFGQSRCRPPGDDRVRGNLSG
jgi:UDP-N-acetylglucosamine 2-epimerase